MMSLSNPVGIPAPSGSNLIIRADTFATSGGFDLSLTCNEDSEIAWRLKRNGNQIVYASDRRRLR